MAVGPAGLVPCATVQGATGTSLPLCPFLGRVTLHTVRWDFGLPFAPATVVEVQYNPGERQAPYYTSFVGRDRCPRNRPPSMAKGRAIDRVVARARAQACILTFSHSLFSTIHIIRTRVIREPILICSDLTTSEGVPSALKLTWKPRPLPQLQARAINTVYQLLQ